MIIDAHCHLPHDGGDFADKKKRLLAEMDKNKVDQAIVIADNVESSIGRTSDLLETFGSDQRLFVVTAPNVFLTDQENEIEDIKNFLSKSNVVALKIFCGHDLIYINDPKFDIYYTMCQELGKPVIFHTGINSNKPQVAKYNDPKYIVEVAEKYPGLKIVVAHFFWPEIDYCWNTLKKLDNVFFDLSAMADKEIEEMVGKEKIRLLLIEIANENPEKLIYGSDYKCCEMLDHVRLVESLNLSEEIKKMIYWKNAKRVFGLNILS